MSIFTRQSDVRNRGHDRIFTRQSDVRKRGHVVSILTRQSDVRQRSHVARIFMRQPDVRKRSHVIPIFTRRSRTSESVIMLFEIFTRQSDSRKRYHVVQWLHGSQTSESVVMLSQWSRHNHENCLDGWWQYIMYLYNQIHVHEISRWRPQQTWLVKSTVFVSTTREWTITPPWKNVRRWKVNYCKVVTMTSGRTPQNWVDKEVCKYRT